MNVKLPLLDILLNIFQDSELIADKSRNRI